MRWFIRPGNGKVDIHLEEGSKVLQTGEERATDSQSCRNDQATGRIGSEDGRNEVVEGGVNGAKK